MPTLYKHHALAALLIAVGLDPRVQLAQRQPFQCFERLGQLSAEHGNSIATEHISKVAKRFQYAVRSFVEDQSRSEEHTSELQSLMRISYAVFCLKKKKTN